MSVFDYRYIVYVCVCDLERLFCFVCSFLLYTSSILNISLSGDSAGSHSHKTFEVGKTPCTELLLLQYLVWLSINNLPTSSASLWDKFIWQLKREPNSPSEFQQWTFFQHDVTFINYLDALYVFNMRSIKKSAKSDNLNEEMYLVLPFSDSTSLMWFNSKSLSSNLPQNTNSNVSMFQYPSPTSKYAAPLSGRAPMPAPSPTSNYAPAPAPAPLPNSTTTAPLPNAAAPIPKAPLPTVNTTVIPTGPAPIPGLDPAPIPLPSTHNTAPLPTSNPIGNKAPLPIVTQDAQLLGMKSHISSEESSYTKYSNGCYIKPDGIPTLEYFQSQAKAPNPAPLPPGSNFNVSKYVASYYQTKSNGPNSNDDAKENNIINFPFTVAAKIDNDVSSMNKNPLHYKIKSILNEYESKYDLIDIDNREMTDKLGNQSTRKWSVKGIVDPDKYLSTLKQCDILWKETGIISYYHWIPTVVKVNNDLTKCEILSEIPNLDPYKFKYTLYPLMGELFLSFVKQFEYITNLNLRNYELQIIIKVQDYVINNISEKDKRNSYYGNFHKEGLFEDIIAVGIYYYDISKDIKGGELELTSIKNLNDYEKQFISKSCEINEGTQIVFNNIKCFHRVQRLYGNGNRKIITFHLINPVNRLLSAKHCTVNLKFHTIHYIQYYCRILLNDDNIKFIWELTLNFVIGDKSFIKKLTEKHNQCRRSFVKKTHPDSLLRTMNFMYGGAAPPPD